VGAAGRLSLAAGSLDATASTLNLAMRRRPRYCRDITVSDGAISRLGLELARGAVRLLLWRGRGCAGRDIAAISP